MASRSTEFDIGGSGIRFETKMQVTIASMLRYVTEARELGEVHNVCLELLLNRRLLGDTH